MKGSPDVIKVLNEVLRKELTGINQYFVHAKMCKNWGYEVIYDVDWKESIDEMKHADRLVERILFLEGVPNIAAYDKISIGATVKKQFENDLGLEQAALTVLKPGIKTCLDAQDDATRELRVVLAASTNWMAASHGYLAPQSSFASTSLSESVMPPDLR